LAFAELGTTFIKLGQVLSTRPDLIPPPFVHEFIKLQDSAAPLSFKIIEQQLNKNFHQATAELFMEFDPIPVASASISQVHRARLHTGEEVAIKIQRPDIRRKIDSDLEILREVARLLTIYLPEIALYNPKGIIDEFAKSLHREMDFLREARNIERFNRNFADNDFLVIPQVYWDYCTPTILTMAFLHGRKFSELSDQVLPPATIEKIISRGSEVLLQQIFEHGFFHADPHPGNILLMPDDRIAFLDFGMMGTIDDELREDIGELLYGIIKKDLAIVMRELQIITDIADDTNVRGLRAELADLIDRYYNLPIAKINFEQLLNDLLEISHRFQISLPADLVMMIRALVISESLSRMLYPSFNLVEKTRPFATRLFLHKHDPRHKIKKLLVFLEDSEDLLRSLPGEIKSILRKLRRGEMTVNLQHQNLEELVAELESASTRLSFSLIIAAVIVGSSLIIHSGKGTLLFGIPLLGLIGFLFAGMMGLWLIYNILRSGKLR